MKRLNSILLLTFVFALVSTGFSQQITTHDIGPISGSLAITFPPNPCNSSDVVTFTGSMNVVAQVDASQGTVDVHLNLQDVKGSGTNGTYIANGAADLLSQPYSTNLTLPLHANLFPPSPCRTGFNSQGVLPVTVNLTFDENRVLSSVSAQIACTLDVCPGP